MHNFQEKSEEDKFLDTILATPVMQRLTEFLIEKGNIKINIMFFFNYTYTNHRCLHVGQKPTKGSFCNSLVRIISKDARENHQFRL